MRSIIAFILLVVTSQVNSQTVWHQTLDGFQDFSPVSPVVIELDYARSAWGVGSDIIALDINGDVMWQKKLPESVNLADADHTADGGLIWAGFRNVTEAVPARDMVFLAKTDPNGQVLWMNSYDLADENSGLRCVQVLDNGDILAGGWQSANEDGEGLIQGLVARFDGDGNWQESVLLSEDMSIADVLDPGTGEVYAVGTRNEDSVGESTFGHFNLLKLNSNLEIEFWKEITALGGFGKGVGLDIDQTGNFRAFGDVGGGDFALLTFNSAGTVTENVKISAPQELEAMDIEIAEDGIINMTGRIQIISPQMVEYYRPLGIRVNNQEQQQFAQYFPSALQNSSFLESTATLADGSYCWFSQESAKVAMYKLHINQPLTGCPATQPVLTYTTGDMTVTDVEETTFELVNLTLFDDELVSNSITSEPTMICSENLCDGSVTITVNSVQLCEGESFTYGTTDAYIDYMWYLDGEPLTTDDSGVFLPDVWGFYELSVEVYDEGYCPSSDIQNVTSLPNPVVEFTVPDTVILCQGQSAQIGTVGSYASYQWSTNNIGAFITVSQTNQYWVHVTADNGCEADSDTVQVIVGAYPNPVISVIGGDTVFCANESVQLTTASFPQYLWSTGDETQTIQTNEPGAYTVEVWSDLGCSTVSDTVNLGVLEIPEPFVVTSGPTSWCAESDSLVNLAISENFFEFVWNNDSVDSTFTVSESGVFYYVATDSLGCQNYSDTIVVVEWTSPIISIEDQTTSMGELCQGSVDLSVIAESINYDVSWVDLPGEEGLSLTDLCTGEYTVIVTDAYGCTSSLDIVIDSGIGVGEISDWTFEFYPNPVSDQLNIISEGRIEMIRIHDVLGQLVKAFSTQESVVDLSDMASGQYLLELVIDGQRHFRQFVKN